MREEQGRKGPGSSGRRTGSCEGVGRRGKQVIISKVTIFKALHDVGAASLSNLSCHHHLLSSPPTSPFMLQPHQTTVLMYLEHII